MTLRRSARQHRAVRGAGVILLILGLVHTPLPQPDFHNIRHHDAPGEVCEHHDHLLRWHPGAGVARDVAVLHWHWFLPTAGASDATPEHAGPAVHAHVADWQATPWEDDGPRIAAGATARPLAPPAATPDLMPLPLSDLPLAAVPAPGVGRSRSFCATFAPHAPLSCLFQRWDC